MAGTIRLQVVTPEKIIVDEDVQIVMAPGSLGEFGILTGHTPFLTALTSGALRYKTVNGTEQVLFVGGGFSEALPARVTILAESAEKPEDIDVSRAQSALARAQKRLQAGTAEKIDTARARAALARAIHRMKVANAKGQS